MTAELEDRFAFPRLTNCFRRTGEVIYDYGALFEGSQGRVSRGRMRRDVGSLGCGWRCVPWPCGVVLFVLNQRCYYVPGCRTGPV